MRPLYIFDLDGTLALIHHRRHFVERERGKQDWKAFYAACVDDVPNRPVIEIMERLRYSSEVWIFSGRSDEVRQQTVKWLLKHTSFHPDHFTGLLRNRDILRMRSSGDYTPDDVLKKQWLDAMLPEDRERLVAVFDDRDRVVAMWRANGITCLQVAPGKF